MRPKTQKAISCVLYDVRAETEERVEHRANNITYHNEFAAVLWTELTTGKARR
jgi:hypothetical protein